ncbi:MAG TPA: 3-oxoacyl-ACP reductase family protein [Actinomycetota bacterium]|nr:3-oxoacyl-ACP reductase family protein [Actinomycetota bacterium]
MRDLENKVALVTGASRGIGRASAIALAHRGATVAINYREDKDGAEETARSIEAAGGTATIVRGDVAVDEDVEAMFGEVEAGLGGVEILVANAGATRDRVLPMMREDDWSFVLDVNLTGVWRCVKRAVRPMLRARSGRIIAVSSVAGIHGNVGQANYCAAKAGEIGLIKAVAREVASKGVTANVVAPGYVDTVLFRGVPEQAQTAALAQVPAGRFGTAEEIGAVVGFLASPGASYVNGSVVVVDGGLSS